MANQIKEFDNIDYVDLEYLKKRKILRQYSIKPEIKNKLNIVTDMIYNRTILSLQQFNLVSKTDLYNHIDSFLTDGYLSFEKIFNEEGKVISVVQLDPVTLIKKFDDDGKYIYIQYSENEKLRRILSDEKIIYFIYDNSSTSYVEELIEPYNRLKMVEDLLLSSNINPKTLENKIDLEYVKFLQEKLNESSRIYSKTFDIFINRLSDSFIKNFKK